MWPSQGWRCCETPCPTLVSLQEISGCLLVSTHLGKPTAALHQALPPESPQNALTAWTCSCPDRVWLRLQDFANSHLPHIQTMVKTNFSTRFPDGSMSRVPGGGGGQMCTSMIRHGVRTPVLTDSCWRDVVFLLHSALGLSVGRARLPSPGRSSPLKPRWERLHRQESIQSGIGNADGIRSLPLRPLDIDPVEFYARNPPCTGRPVCTGRTQTRLETGLLLQESKYWNRNLSELCCPAESLSLSPNSPGERTTPGFSKHSRPDQ